jgi:plasmid maintenance system antidote protein VapI
MKNIITHSYIAKKLGVSATFINRLVNGAKRPNWKRAKELSKITGSKPELWLEGNPEQIRNFLNSKRVTTNDKGA